MITKINSFGDFHEFIQSYSGFAYRGVTNASYQLIPGIGREWKVKRVDPIGLKDLEIAMLRKFRQQAIQRIETKPENDWEWLFLAQHHGLPTRLLDWTINPLVSTYFACRKESDTDAALYVIKPLPSLQCVDFIEEPDPFSITDIKYLWPPHVTPRLAVQSGIFTIHPNPQTQWSSKIIDKILISASARTKILEGLKRYGIHESSLFPDLDGLGRHLKIEIKQMNNQLVGLNSIIEKFKKSTFT